MAWIQTRRFVIVAVLCLLAPLALLVLLPRRAAPPVPTPERPAEPTSRRPAAVSHEAWKLESALQALERQPDNLYLQYVALQLARPSRVTEVLRRLPRRPGPEADLFSLFSSRQAVAEALQQAFLFSEGPAAPSAPERAGAGFVSAPYVPGMPYPANLNWAALAGLLMRVGDSGSPVALAELRGPNLAGPSWDKLLAGKKVEVSPLARCVPDEFYLAEFRSAASLLEALAQGRRWSSYFATQARLDAAGIDIARRVQEQLALDVSPALRGVLDATTTGIALTGSDPFLAEGSDVTVLLQLRRPEDFRRAYADRTLDAATRAHGEVQRSEGKLLGVDYIELRTPDRALSIYAASPRPDLYVRSNSKVALRRVLEAVLGKTARRLGDSAELRYLRTLMPAKADEDGILYVSEAFLRHLISPQLRLTERRRLIGATHLRMIAFAAQLYRTQFGKAPASLEELASSGCAPGEFNKGVLTCPFGGTYSLNADRTAGLSSVLNRADFLTPCCELALSEVSTEEARDYAQFVRAYDRSWRSYFGPLTLRLRSTGRQFQAEIALPPLRDNPLYAGLTRLLGGQAEALEALPVPPRSLFSVNLRLNPEGDWLFKVLGRLLADPQDRERWPVLLQAEAPSLAKRLQDAGLPPEKVRRFLDQGLGKQLGVHLYDTALTFDVNYAAALGQVLSIATAPGGAELQASQLLEAGVPALIGSSLLAPVYLAIPVQDARIVDEFLELLDPLLARRVPAWRDTLLPGTGELQGEFYHLTARRNVPVRALGVRVGPLRWRWYWARIGDGLYLANQPAVLDDLQETHQRREGAAPGPEGHALVRLRPGHWQQALGQYQLGWAENDRSACQRNLSFLSAVARAFSSTPPVNRLAPTQEERQRLVLDYAGKMYGADFACPAGGQYHLAEDGHSCRCSIHGSQDHPQQAEEPARASPSQALRNLQDASATLTLTAEGPRLVLTLESK